MHLERFEARQLLSASDIDASFAGQGAILGDLGPQATVRATAAQADDKFVIAGSRGSNALLARYEAGGAIDLTFGNNGVVWLDLGGNEYFTRLALLADGKIMAGGNIGIHSNSQKAFVARFRGDGSIDTSFGGGDGVVIIGAAGESLIALAASDAKFYTL